MYNTCRYINTVRTSQKYPKKMPRWHMERERECVRLCVSVWACVYVRVCVSVWVCECVKERKSVLSSNAQLQWSIEHGDRWRGDCVGTGWANARWLSARDWVFFHGVVCRPKYRGGPAGGHEKDGKQVCSCIVSYVDIMLNSQAKHTRLLARAHGFLSSYTFARTDADITSPFVTAQFFIDYCM